MQNVEPVIQAIQTLQSLPESNRTEYYDTVVAPQIDSVADSLKVERDAGSLIKWLYIQSAALDFAVEGITEVTYELNQQSPEELDRAISSLPPEQQLRIRWLLREFEGDENLSPDLVGGETDFTLNFNRLADDVRAAPRLTTGIMGEFVGTGTLRSSRGFPIIHGTFTLFKQSGEVFDSYTVNNGGGAQNYRMRNGPLPPGFYRVSNHRPNRTDNREGKDRGMILEGVGYSFDLHPTDGTQVFGRSLFRIHPDGNPLGTNGCLGLRENASRLRECENHIAGLLRDGGAFKISVSF